MLRIARRLLSLTLSMRKPITGAVEPTRHPAVCKTGESHSAIDNRVSAACQANVDVLTLDSVVFLYKHALKAIFANLFDLKCKIEVSTILGCASVIKS